MGDVAFCIRASETCASFFVGSSLAGAIRSANVTRPLSEPAIGGSEWQLVHLAARTDWTLHGRVPEPASNLAPDDELDELEPEDDPLPDGPKPSDDGPPPEDPEEPPTAPEDELEPDVDSPPDELEELELDERMLLEEPPASNTGAPIGVQTPRSEFVVPLLQPATAPSASAPATRVANRFICRPPRAADRTDNAVSRNISSVGVPARVCDPHSLWLLALGSWLLALGSLACGEHGKLPYLAKIRGPRESAGECVGRPLFTDIVAHAASRYS